MLPTRNDYSFKAERETVKKQWALSLYQNKLKEEGKKKNKSWGGVGGSQSQKSPLQSSRESFNSYLLTDEERKLTVGCKLGNKGREISVHQLPNQEHYSFQMVLSFYEESFMTAECLRP